jgi:cobyrinic acid a,c-diamide synthase
VAEHLASRIVVAGTHSGVGKTTVATGLMAALRARALGVGAAKVGPDFIDPGYHALAVGRPSRNLDMWMSGPAAVPALAARAASGSDVLVVEGVMGLFDGAGDGTPSSTADVAALLDAPVLLVVDASAMSQSVAALVSGYARFDPRVRVSGIVLNRVGSPGHEQLLREALVALGIPIVGVLHRDDRLEWRGRHLGLVPVVERPKEVSSALEVLAALIERNCDLDAIMRIASAAPARAVQDIERPRRVGAVRIAVAGGPAFSFSYPDNVEALEAAGAEIVPFDPMTASAMPTDCQALVAGGGFPEVYVAELAANRPLLADVCRHVERGLVVWAECGGLLWLADRLDGRDMAGVVPASGAMTKRLTLGYREAELRCESPIGPAGTRLRGHEFHYSVCEPAGDAMDMSGRHGQGRAGFATPQLLASYLHVHLANRPDIAERFVARAAGDRALRLPYTRSVAG